MKSQYLKDLSNLLINEVDQNRISTKLLFEKISQALINRSLNLKLKIRFDDKDSLRNVVQCLENIINGEKLYLLTADSKDYGAYKLLSINEFNVDFKFRNNTAGIFSIVSEKLDNEIIFDFYIENKIEYLEMEIYGNKWPLINIKFLEKNG